MSQLTVLGSAKKIINGKAYNTDISTLIYAEGADHDASLAHVAFYQTRHGEFWVWSITHQGDCDKFGPITDEEAKAWLEKWANHLVEQYFGPCPEGGASERRLTIRLPTNLANRIEAAAAEEGISLNSYAMRCFERCAREGGRAAPVR